MSQLTQTSTDELVDIREVAVDKDLPKEERIAAFLHQIKNPYRFRCGDFALFFAAISLALEVSVFYIITFYLQFMYLSFILFHIIFQFWMNSFYYAF